MITLKQKEDFIEELTKTPVIQVVCQKLHLSRASYYRWRQEDADFALRADEALRKGTDLVNDMAEWQLMTLIKEKNLGALTFWLKHRHTKFSSRLEVSGSIKHEIDELTTEQKEIVEQALKLAGFDILP